MNYIEEFADEVKTDNAGNVIGILNPQAQFKVLLAAHSDEIGLIIKYIDDKGYLYFDKVGGVNLKTLVGAPVEIITKTKTLSGVVGVNAQHLGGLKDNFELHDIYIDCGFTSKIEAEERVGIGDLVVHKATPQVLMDRYITGKALDNKTGLFIIAEVLRLLKERSCSVGVYAVSTVNEETNKSGAYYASAAIKPSIGIACDVTFATDFPSVDKKKHGYVELGMGPVLAKGSPINEKINYLLEKTAKKIDIDIQYELNPVKTSTDADQIQFTGYGVPITVVSLPLRYMHSPVEVVSMQDIKDEIELLTSMIISLIGTEKFSPFHG